jgi:hypothetical protein
MNPSPGVLDLVNRAYGVLLGGEGNADALFLDDDRVLAIGSDPGEWWIGRDAIASMFRAQGASLRGSRIEGSAPEAFEQAGAGWVSDRLTIVMADGTSVPFRVTATAVRDEGTWRFVQWHGSVAVRNEDTVGTTLPTSPDGSG